jgi:hypothetical protein
MATEQQLDALYARFLATEEAEEWYAFIEAARAALEGAGGDTVTVPAAFLRRAIGQMGAAPLMFDHLRQAHDRIAAEMGLPEEGK